MKQEAKEIMSEVVRQHHFHFKIFKELQGPIKMLSSFSIVNTKTVKNC